MAGDLVPREAFSSPKGISTGLALYDDGNCTKLSPIKRFFLKNPAHGRHQIYRLMRIVGTIQFWRVCMIYLEKKKKTKIGRLTRPRVHASARPHDGSTRGRWMLCTHPPFLGLHACNKMGSTPVLPRKIRQNQQKPNFFSRCDSRPLPKKMFKSETTSIHFFSPRIPTL